MIRLLTTLSILLSLSVSCLAQQLGVCMEVVASSGGKGIQSNRQLSWTVGEPFMTTMQGAGYAFTQGFHQPDPCGKESVGTFDLADWGLNLFPNPTEGWLTLQYAPDKNRPLIASVFDLLGRPMLIGQTLASAHGSAIDASAWPPGVYFLRLQDPGSKASATLRFVRL